MEPKEGGSSLHLDHYRWSIKAESFTKKYFSCCSHRIPTMSQGKLWLKHPCPSGIKVRVNSSCLCSTGIPSKLPNDVLVNSHYLSPHIYRKKLGEFSASFSRVASVDQFL